MMSNELVDRYVGATLRTVPEGQRGDIEAELRASIEDAVEARVDAGTDVATAEREVLSAMGDPDRLAAGYSGRPGYLIGPTHFFDYKRFLSALLVTVVPVVVAVTAAISAISGEDIGSIFGRSISLGITLVVHIVFWTTLVFALIERTGTEDPNMEWSLDKLPPAPSGASIGLGETIATVVFLVLAMAALLVARTASPVTGADGETIPIFAPEMWSFWLPFLIVVLAIEVLFELAKYRVGRWTWSLASVNLALNALFVIPAIYLLLTGQLLNPAFFEDLGWGNVADSGGSVILGVVIVMAAVALWDTIDGFRKASR
jgi:hypothetical protein